MSGSRRAIYLGAAAALLFVAAGAALLVVRGRSPEVAMARPGDKLFVVVASRSASDSAQVAQLTAILDISSTPPTLQLVDPAQRVTLPGVTYDKLRDAYSFGGGPRVALAWAENTRAQPMPVLTVTEEGLVRVVDGLGGIEVDVPTGANVFDGKRLYVFRKGPNHVGGTGVRALLIDGDQQSGRDEPSDVRSAVAAGLVAGLSGQRPDLSDLVREGLVTSTLKPSDLSDFGTRARDRSGNLQVLQPGR